MLSILPVKLCLGMPKDHGLPYLSHRSKKRIMFIGSLMIGLIHDGLMFGSPLFSPSLHYDRLGPSLSAELLYPGYVP